MIMTKSFYAERIALSLAKLGKNSELAKTIHTIGCNMVAKQFVKSTDIHALQDIIDDIDAVEIAIHCYIDSLPKEKDNLPYRQALVHAKCPFIPLSVVKKMTWQECKDTLDNI
jgi:hypothetical protein